MRQRPLSPHLSVYKFKYTMTSSILNRFTGVGLSVGLILVAYWLMALANGRDAYAKASAFLSHDLMKVLYFLWLVAFVYHLVAGLRHLTWDTGRGLEREQSRKSAYLIGVVTAVLVVVLAYFMFFGRAVTP